GDDGPPRKEPWKDPEFLRKLAEALRPTLRFFRRSNVEAVGVFGDDEARLAILPLVRAELPDAQLFTSDAAWMHEPPATETRERTKTDQKEGDRPAGGGHPPSLDGLLVFTSGQPPRKWAEAQFVDFGMEGGRPEPFLPDAFQLCTAHVVKRL